MPSRPVRSIEKLLDGEAIKEPTITRGLLDQIDMMLASGGDERIVPDPVTGRNRYGTTTSPASHEIWFSSSTASTISRRGYLAAAQAWARVSADPYEPIMPLHSWFDRIRAELAERFGAPGSQVILTASGTEGELFTLALATSLLERPLTNIVIAPNETGSGVIRAAAGRHFLASSSQGFDVENGKLLEGFDDKTLEVVSIDIRHGNGELRDAADVDRDAACAAETALRDGRCVLLHILDASKTGVAGVSRAAARAIAAAAPERVLVLVDACQLRCPAAQLRQDVEEGFLVSVTGSKFMGGPPFCGAVIVPAAVAARLNETVAAPVGLTAYCAAFDLPAELRGWFAHGFGSLANIGLALRWTAALAEIGRYASVPAVLRNKILSTFTRKARARVGAQSWLRLDASPFEPAAEPVRQSIVSVIPAHPSGRLLSMAEAGLIHQALRQAEPAVLGDAVCHVGQPVAIGDKAALRLCASAPLVSDVADRMEAGLSFTRAFEPICRDLDALIAKWARLSV